MNFETILYENKDGITTITLNRPDQYNAFTEVMREELLTAFQTADGDQGCRVVVLTGAGKAFCSGQDLKNIAGQKVDFKSILNNGYNPLIKAMRTLPKPIVGKINGVAAGAGCSLALACDYIVASENSNFIEVFVGVGLVLDSGSSYFLPRSIGSNRAFELASLGEKLPAIKAAEWGLINKVVPVEKLDEEVNQISRRYAKSATKAIGWIKEMLNKTGHSSLEEVLNFEAHYQELAGNTLDYQEGLLSFLEKRKPHFTNS